MYRAKSLGGARHELFDESMHLRVRERIQTERELHRALDRDELRLHYQPEVVPRPTASASACEALLRWEHPERGLVVPATSSRSPRRPG